MMICVMPIEGVISQSGDLRQTQPQRWARPLYDALHTQYQMIALTLATQEVAQWWLRRETMRDWAGVLTKPDAYNTFDEWKVRQIEEFLAEGWEIGLMVDTDGECLERINALGVLTMKLSYPSNRVGWKVPEEAPRAWSTMVENL